MHSYKKESEHSAEFKNGSGFNPYTERVIDSWSQLELCRGNHDVFIDRSQLNEVARTHYRDQLEIPAWRFNEVYPQDNMAFASNVLAHNTINAAFNLSTGEKYTVPFGEKKPLTGVFGMVRKFYEGFGEKIITTADLDKVFTSLEDTTLFFNGINEIPYPDLRYYQLRDLINNLQRLGLDPTDLLMQIDRVDQQGNIIGHQAFNSGNSQGLVDLLIQQFPLAYGADRQSIGRLDFPFYKRAQLVALELHGRAVNTQRNQHSLIQPFVDIDQIGPIADYEIPRSLRGLGIIKISDSLASKIESWKEIAKDSQEEVEIRASMVVACASLLQGINKLRREDHLSLINMAHLDYWLWSQAEHVAKNIKPHLTKTMSY